MTSAESVSQGKLYIYKYKYKLMNTYLKIDKPTNILDILGKGSLKIYEDLNVSYE